MAMSTTHPILSMWILIYPFDTYYVWAACDITQITAQHENEAGAWITFYFPILCLKKSLKKDNLPNVQYNKDDHYYIF